MTDLERQPVHPGALPSASHPAALLSATAPRSSSSCPVPAPMIRSSQRRGRHKVFIGMAPGVGMTCLMLQEGHERLRDGSDVVIGLLETHGRRETARQAEGLEQVPRKRLRHCGLEREELDVAAVLERRPQLMLVDELAHSNAPGSERAKRWQDVEALLLSGVDVYSTPNIQHLESLNDRVAELTGVLVGERIPNRVLEQALAGYFHCANLIALRERVMVCITTAPSAQRRNSAGFRGIRRAGQRCPGPVLESRTPPDRAGW